MEVNVEKTDGWRVTRARTRRNSVLDTDSRPVTPQLELAPDRDSPRPLRKTRLNSATIDLRTPTRTTRQSVARGETPEPLTSSASGTMRQARTSTKSVCKQLPLHEEEEDFKIKEEPTSRTPTPTGENHVTRSMSKTPPFASNGEATGSLAKQPFKPTKTEFEKSLIIGTSNFVEKVEEISGSLLKSPISILENEMQNQKKDQLIGVFMKVDELDILEMLNTSTETNNIPISDSQSQGENVEAVFLEKSIGEAAGSDNSKEESTYEIFIAPDEKKSVKKIVLEESIFQENIQSNFKEAGNISTGEIIGSVFVGNPLEQIKPVEEDLISADKETIAVSTENKGEIISVYVDEAQKETVVVESDSSFMSVEETSPTSERKFHIGGQIEAEEISDANYRSFASMRSVFPIDQQEDAKMEPEETDYKDVLQDSGGADPVEGISNIRLSDFLPVASPIDKKVDSKKSVVFNFIEKKTEAPLKPQAGNAAIRVDNSTETAVQPTARVDAVKPLVQEIEVVSKSWPSAKVIPHCLVSDNEESEIANVENICVLNKKVEVAGRKIEEHEIPCNEKSVGSQDSIESVKDEEAEGSFTVSDKDAKAEKVLDVIEPLCSENEELDEAVVSNSLKDKKQSNFIVDDAELHVNKTSSHLEISTIDQDTTVSEISVAKVEPQEKVVVIEPKPFTLTGEGDCDKEVFLPELPSSDLSQFKKMFNPPQKARHQSLHLPSPKQMTKKESKLKRHSVQMLHHFNFSQPLMEMAEERQRQQPKRQRLSKSFYGAVDKEVLKEKTLDVQFKSEQKKKAETAVPKDKAHNKKEAIVTESSLSDSSAYKESIDHYMKYCKETLEAASQVKLEQKKLAVAVRENGAMKKKKAKRQDQPTVEIVANSKVNRLIPDKKQHLQKVVNRAIELLVPQTQKKSFSVWKPPITNVKAKDKPKKTSLKENLKKDKQVVAIVKSSDEENDDQQPIERFKNKVGYVDVYRDDSPPRTDSELIKTKSGIIRVEPSTPTSKYFQEMPVKNRKCFFHEEVLVRKDCPAKKLKPKAPKAVRSSRAAGRKYNSATESAIRFKNRVLSRK